MSQELATWDPERDDEVSETVHVTRLLRWIGLFLAWPGITIAGAFILFEDAGEHAGHITLSLSFGSIGVFVALLSRRIAEKYT